MGIEPGRFCPKHYHYGADALAVPARFSADPLVVAGGLYGNPEALDALEALVAAEDAALVLNGDFHWFDAEPTAFGSIQRRVLAHTATAGNVEAELAHASGAGCGCAYPDRVDDATVARANAIMERLRESAAASECDRLGQLPYFLTASVGDHRVAVIHGDPDDLAGWGLDAEALEPEGGTTVTRLIEWFRRAEVDVFASSHTCLPHALALRAEGRERAIINNGAAGMPNFHGDLRGVVTRIATTASPRALYRVTLAGLVVEALPLEYDADAWLRRFERWWPAGSPAHLSYAERLRNGPSYHLARSLGPGAEAPVPGNAGATEPSIHG